MWEGIYRQFMNSKGLFVGIILFLKFRLTDHISMVISRERFNIGKWL